jgi:predicted nucleotidyltransferase
LIPVSTFVLASLILFLYVPVIFLVLTFGEIYVAFGELNCQRLNMISQQTIDDAVQRLIAAAQPQKIILFGSYARGEATDDSDLDFLVILPALVNKHQEMVRLRRVLRPLRISVDVLVASKAEVDEWGHLPSTTLYWALKEGKVLHEAAN